MHDLVIGLFEPEIPPNTGSIMRLAANTGARLALIEPLGFELTDARLRRAGLDYRELATTTTYAGIGAFQEAFADRRMLLYSTRGRARYDQVRYSGDDVLLFGPESQGPAPGATRCRACRTPGPHSDASALAQSESRQRGVRGRLRGLAAARIRRRRRPDALRLPDVLSRVARAAPPRAGRADPRRRV